MFTPLAMAPDATPRRNLGILVFSLVSSYAVTILAYVAEDFFQAPIRIPRGNGFVFSQDAARERI